MPSPLVAPSAFTRAELEAVAIGLGLVIADEPEHRAAQSAAAKVRDEIRKRN
jgi:hypothetical protein